MQNDKHRGSLGSKFEGFGAAPSEGMWDAIADSLDAKKKRKIPVWWWIGSGIAAAGLIAFLVVSKADFWNAKDSKGSVAEIRQDFSKEANLSEEQYNGRVRDVAGETVRFQEKQNVQDRLQAVTTENSFAQDVDNDHNDMADNEDDSHNDNENGSVVQSGEKHAEALVIAEPVEDRVDVKLVPPSAIDQIDLAFAESPLERPLIESRPKGKWEIGFGLNSWNAYALPGFRKSEQIENLNQDPEVDSSFMDMEIEEAAKLPVGWVLAHKPLGLKLHVGYQFNQRLRITSGVLAEYAFYTPEKNTAWGAELNNGQLDQKQVSIRQFSLGIPVGVNYDFLKGKRFRMGAGLNVLNEFPILQRYKPLDNVIAYSAAESKKAEKNQVAVSGYELGLNLNLNVSYYLNEKWRLQLSPGIRYYTYEKNKSQSSGFALPERKFWPGGAFMAVYEF